MKQNLTLFPKSISKHEKVSGKAERVGSKKPLSELLRPSEWNDFFGLDDIKGDLLKKIQETKGNSPSLIFWGPPGSGKTTLAKIIGQNSGLNFIEFSAVLGGVKEVREIVEEARESEISTILFVDEIHRFNKAQQDAFLPHVEKGTIILFGATTENPSFYLNQALLSRARVIVLPPLSIDSLAKILERAEKKLSASTKITFTEEAKKFLISFAAGDARRLLNLIESLSTINRATDEISEQEVISLIGDKNSIYYDRDGEEHYNLASAFIKSMRGSDPDAALYWGFRMLEGGEDPRFLCRRMIIFASEDIGNADPRALTLAVSTAEAYDRIGLPEGRIPIAQCITYLASAPKSNRSYLAMHKVVDAIKEDPTGAVPLHIRNAPTKLMKSLDYGKDYTYPHDTEAGYVPNVDYLPEDLIGRKFYEPKDVGFEKMIKERFTKLKHS